MKISHKSVCFLLCLDLHCTAGFIKIVKYNIILSLLRLTASINTQKIKMKKHDLACSQVQKNMFFYENEHILRFSDPPFSA